METRLRRIATVEVRGANVPWSTPETFLGGRPGGKRAHVHRKNPRLVAWQDAIRAACDRERCTAAAFPTTPYAGAVMLALTFTKAHPDPARWGRRWWSRAPSVGHGDLTNYAKAAEDAVKTWTKFQGKGPDRRKLWSWPGIIEEDSQVCDSFLRKRYGREDGARICVYAIDEDEDQRP